MKCKKKWYLQLIWNYSPPTIYWQFPSAISPFYKLVWPFLWCWKVSGLKKDLLQRGHTNPTPKCTFGMWAQMVAWEVDGPSLQPSTWHLYTLLMPPSWMQRGCMWAGISSSEAGGTAREADSSAWPCRSRDFRSCGLLRGQMGDSGRRGMASLLRGRWGMWAGKSVILLPSEAHRNPLPLNQPLLLPFLLALLFLSTGLSPPVCEPPCIMSWPTSANPTPAKKDQKGNHRGSTTKEKPHEQQEKGVE